MSNPPCTHWLGRLVYRFRKVGRLSGLSVVSTLEEPSGLESRWLKLAGLSSASPKVWMDAYLAAFAILHEAEFVTLDQDFQNFEKDGLKLRLLGADR